MNFRYSSRYNICCAHVQHIFYKTDNSRLIFGKNKVIAYALGRTVEDEQAENVHKISNKLVNEVGILFTNKSKEDVLEWVIIK